MTRDSPLPTRDRPFRDGMGTSWFPGNIATRRASAGQRGESAAERVHAAPARLGALWLLCAMACTGVVGEPRGPREESSDTSSAHADGAAGDDDGPTSPGGGLGGDDTGAVQPFEAVSAASALRKVKGVLTGLAPSDEELAAFTSGGEQALRARIDGWLETPEFRARALYFFSQVFQQTGFDPVADFKFQLSDRPGAMALPYGIFGDDAFPRLSASITQSFALTVWGLVEADEPLTRALTTDTFMLTPALESLYLMIDRPRDVHDVPFRFDQDARPPLQETLDPRSPNYMRFGYEPAASVSGARVFVRDPASQCNGVSTFDTDDGVAGPLGGSVNLFHLLVGSVDRTPECMEHGMRPYFSEADLSEYRPRRVRKLNPGEEELLPWDLPAIRASSELAVRVPRVGFFTTPAFLALWNTNDSNQHRVTANQTLLVALGRSFTASDTIIPVQTDGLDGDHAVEGSLCYFCHKGLDPLRAFWDHEFAYSDKPRGDVSVTGGVFAFGNVNEVGRSMADLGLFLSRVADDVPGEAPLARFAINMTQKLCFFADSAGCAEDDPEFRRIARAFQDGGYRFKSLVRDLMSSPLVTGRADTETFARRNVVFSIQRRAQLCASLSSRLGMADVCGLEAPVPTPAQVATARLAGSLASDAFSRGSELPVTPSAPNLFYRAASELLCENVAARAVDADGSPFSSADVDAALSRMVVTLLGYPPSQTAESTSARAILRAHYDEARAASGSATTALRSVFATACQAPTFLSVGL